MKKKRPLTLLEVIIALGLTTILLSALLGYYRHVATFNLQLKAAKHKYFARHRLDLRLSPLLSTLHLETLAFEKKAPPSPLYTTSYQASVGQALVFQCDHGLDRSPRFCNEVEAMLYLDRQKNLCLVIWPNDEEQSKSLSINRGRKEVLLEDVSSFCFHFFDMYTGKWETQWSKEKRSLPALIKLTLHDGSSKQPFTLVYFLDGDNIVYSS